MLWYGAFEEPLLKAFYPLGVKRGSECMNYVNLRTLQSGTQIKSVL